MIPCATIVGRPDLTVLKHKLEIVPVIAYAISKIEAIVPKVSYKVDAPSMCGRSVRSPEREARYLHYAATKVIYLKFSCGFSSLEDVVTG
jgi:hypothetical protein